MPNVKTTYFSLPKREETRTLIAVISDEESVVGFLLAGIGESFGPGRHIVNVKIVNEATTLHDIKEYFVNLYYQQNVGVVLIAEDIWHHLEPRLSHLRKKNLPVIVQIPSKIPDGSKWKKPEDEDEDEDDV